MLKRAFDIVVAGCLLIVLSPLLAVLAVSVWLSLGRPVLFGQERAGFEGRRFRIYKFRTMTTEVDATGRLLPDAERLSAFGTSLRKSSLDELPELFNVISGQMSLVGPRPLLAEYLDRYTAEQRRRHDVRPGITGWAQVRGRNAIRWEERFELDTWYVDHRSFPLDLRILLMTVGCVLRRQGVSQEGHVTMPEFGE